MGPEKSTILPAACLAATLQLCCALQAWPQQPAASPPGPGRGGGFAQPEPIDFNDHNGWTSMFDGKTLNGWDGDKSFWHVQDGAIVVESTCEKPTGTIYLIWQGGEPADFEMKLEMKGEGAAVNSGIQYRGAITDPNRPRAGGGGRGGQAPCPSGAPRGTPPAFATQAKWDMLGPQFDFDGRNNYTGQFYEQATGRGIIAWRGQVVRTEEGKTPRLIASLGDRDALAGYVHIDDWNQLHLIARGIAMTHIVNGHLMSILIDDDPTRFRKSGLTGFEIEGTGKISIRNIWLKKL
jgi:3-keto-disaccharide hydrolase